VRGLWLEGNRVKTTEKGEWERERERSVMMTRDTTGDGIIILFFLI
jgi:hypothetical protein